MRVYKANVGPRICTGTADPLSAWIDLEISEHEPKEWETDSKCYNVVSPDKNLNSARERFFPSVLTSVTGSITGLMTDSSVSTLKKPRRPFTSMFVVSHLLASSAVSRRHHVTSVKYAALTICPITFQWVWEPDQVILFQI